MPKSEPESLFTSMRTIPLAGLVAGGWWLVLVLVLHTDPFRDVGVDAH